MPKDINEILTQMSAAAIEYVKSLEIYSVTRASLEPQGVDFKSAEAELIRINRKKVKKVTMKAEGGELMYWFNLADIAKTFKVGDCQEMAAIAAFYILSQNFRGGIYLVNLAQGGESDHAFVCLSLKGMLYVVDPWAGLYYPFNDAIRYLKEYRQEIRGESDDCRSKSVIYGQLEACFVSNFSDLNILHAFSPHDYERLKVLCQESSGVGIISLDKPKNEASMKKARFFTMPIEDHECDFHNDRGEVPSEEATSPICCMLKIYF